ncbi:MAG: type II secretion system minor pseudopilin GspJ [Gammaproteobacteria bacterium]|nr:type II secretion system minor pseudopilin GspJ [Gammaproteobacteria bacterium]MDH5801893.1 type II secretion system minor pseudopilin GspJ [Gammaproteobacteria bacterium]
MSLGEDFGKSLNSNRGFTLLELLIAVMIFSLMAAMAYAGLNNVLDQSQRTQEFAERLTRLQSAFTWLGRDIEQTIDRGIRDELSVEADALVGNQLGEYLLSLTRTGWLNPNPNATPRSSMQRVAYTLKDEQLIRSIWYVLDRTQDSERYDMVLLEDVKSLEFRYLDSKQKWHSSWPPDTAINPQTGAKMPWTAPAGVAVQLETKSFGKMERWFRVPGA